MFFSPENYVRIAVVKAGGPTYLSNRLSLSNGCIHSWIRKGRISNIGYARQVADMSGIRIELLRPVL